MTFLGSIILKAVIVSAIILAVTVLVRRQSATMQSAVIHLGLGVLLATPVMAGAFHFSGIGFALHSASQTAAPAESSRIAAPQPQSTLVAPPVASVGAERQSQSALAAPVVLVPTISLLWLLPSVVLLLQLVHAHAKVRSLLHHATEIDEGEVLRAFSGLLEKNRSRQAVRLFVSPAVDSPISVGFVRAAIILDPKTLQQRMGLESILAHELAHIAARDSLRLCVSKVATAIYWFNPLVWTLERRASFVREAAADERVVTNLQRPIEYATVLATHARTRVFNPFQVAHAIAPGKTEFKARIHRILNQHAVAPDNRSLSYGALLVGLAAPLLVAAYGQVERNQVALPSLQAEVSRKVSQRIVAAAAPSSVDQQAVAQTRPATGFGKDTNQQIATAVQSHAVAEGMIQVAGAVPVELKQEPVAADEGRVSKSVGESLVATIASMDINGVGFRVSSREPRFAEKAQEIFPKLAGLSAIEMSMLSGAASIEDLAALRDYGLQNLGFHEILPATSLGVRSGFLEVATRNGCTHHTLDELMGIAAIGAVPGEVPAAKHRCDVPTVRLVDVRLRPFNG